jgi:long-chain acyl-CoA synthetase
MAKHFFDYLQATIKRDWNEPAISDYIEKKTDSYGDLATQIARWHVLFKELGIEKGDKIALCGRNSTYWATCFLATLSYEAVAVSILDAFHADSIHYLVKHSDAKLFLVGDQVYAGLNNKEMSQVEAIICQDGKELFYSKTEKAEKAFKNWEKLFAAAYPNGFSADDVNYPTDNMEKPAVINYTSGSTGDPKGVVLNFRSISSNVEFGQDNIPNKAGWSMVSMLPLAHMFGLTFEFLYQLAGGCHVYFLGKTPSPQVLMKAFSEVNPYMILTVPLVVEKIFKGKIFPAIKKPLVRVLWHIPGISGVIRKKVHQQLMAAFGGNLKYLIIGGAALNREVETCLKQIKFPYCVGYGMTECGPLLAYSRWDLFKQRSCGRVVDRMQLTIDSLEPTKQVGEILVKGDNLLLGYYKNPEATQAIFTSDGWMRTGDLGILDKEGNVFIRGRNKSMILGPSGQNIYPEEIEDKVNNMEYVIESVLVSRNEKLVALVYADTKAIEQAGKTPQEAMEQMRIHVNRLLPKFCQVSSVELVSEEFEKTPKRSIKRYLYK